MKKLFLFFILLFFLFCPTGYASKNNGLNFEGVIYSGFRTIQNFGSLRVSLKGSAEEIGLNEYELTHYLKSRFKNSFAKYEFNEVNNLFDAMQDNKIAPTIGLIHIQVWTVGDDYPIAYHISINSGNLNNASEYTNACLGFGSKSNVPDTIKENISRFIDELAIAFFESRGEF